MRNFIIIILIFGLGISGSGFGSEGEQTRILVFAEEGFPGNSGRDINWYETVLGNAGYKLQRASIEDLQKPDLAEVHDILLFPTGHRQPLDGAGAIEQFLSAGKIVLLDGHALKGDWKLPEEVTQKAAELREKFLQGEDIETYRDYLFTHGVSSLPSHLLRFDKEQNRWITPIDNIHYLTLQAKLYFEELEVEAWPNHNTHSISGNYGRAWDEPVHLHPELARIKDIKLPEEVLPPTDHTHELMRVQLMNRERQQVVELGNDVFYSLYFFKEPSGERRHYQGYPEASRSEKDREGDFFIYRMNRPQRPGATIIHFGYLGQELLKSEQGEDVLLATLRLADGKLPGEHSKDYIDAFNESLSAQSKFSVWILETIALLKKWQLNFITKGKIPRRPKSWRS